MAAGIPRFLVELDCQSVPSFMIDAFDLSLQVKIHRANDQVVNRNDGFGAGVVLVLERRLPDSRLGEEKLAGTSSKLELLDDVGETFTRVTIAFKMVACLRWVMTYLFRKIFVIFGDVFISFSQNRIERLFEPINAV